MSTSGNAVFSEVLSLQVDSSQFAAQMKEVEAIYEASLERMQSSAEAANIAGGLSDQAEEAASAWGRFGDMFERQMARIPARMAAMAVITAAIAPVIAAVEELKIGFENLAQSSPDFHKTIESLKDLNTEFASQAAKPLFDLLLSGMEKVNEFLKQNKPAVDGLAASFGQLLSEAVKSFFAIFSDNKELVTGFFRVLGLLVGDLVTGFSLLALSFKAVFVDLLGNIAVFVGRLAGIDWKHPWEGFKDAALSSFEDIKKGMSNTVEETQQLLEKNAQFTRNLFGAEQTPGAEVPIAEKRTLSDMRKEFSDKLSAVKDYYAEVSAVIKASVADHVISHQAAAPILKGYLDAEQKQVSDLVNTYKNLATTAKGAKPDEIVKTQEGYDITGNNTRKALTKESLADQQAANAERLANEKLFSAARLKILDDDEKAELALIKKAVAEGRLTRADGNAAEIADEQQRHFAALQEIASRQAAPGSREDAQKQVAIVEENARNQNALNALREQGAEATKQDTAALDAHNAAMLKAQEAYISGNLETEKAIGNKLKERDLTRELIALKLREADVELAVARNKLSDDAGTPAAMKDQERVAQLQATIKNLEAELNRAQGTGSPLGNILNGTGTQSPRDQLMQSLGLDKMKQDFEDAAAQTDTTTRALGEFASGVEGAVGVMKGLADAVDGAIAGYKKAGAMGAAASLLQNSNVTDTIGSIAGKASESLGSMVPVIGPMIGQMFSAISGLFQAGIQTMVNNINQQVQNINLAAQTKQIGIQQQIAELKAEEQSAIQALGGKKKASSQLTSILNSLNSQITQLQYQAQQTVQQFNDMVAAANTGNAAGNSVASQWLNTWQQINAQVESYIQAGGSLATAAAYMNQQLQQQQQALTSQLNQGNVQAIQDALQLNQLEQQKVDMMKQEAATEFGMLNSDSVERRTASAVATGVALTTQRNAYAQQLLDLNNQITAEQEKVAAESKVFDLNQSIAALQNNQNALNIAALNQQLQSYQEMQAIIKATNGMVFTPGSINPGAGLNGSQAPIPGEPGVAGPVIGTVNVTTTGPVTSENAATLGAAIASNIRSGRTTFTTPKFT